MVPWDPSRYVDLISCICPPFLYLWAVEKAWFHRLTPHLPPLRTIIPLKIVPSNSPDRPQIQHNNGALEPFQLCRPDIMHLSSLSIPMGSGKQPWK